VLVNNVGAVHVRLDGFLSLTDADFDASLQVNLFSAVRATRAAVRDMSARRAGTIVNVASVAAFVNVAKSLSQELGSPGIRITSVSPGPVATDLWLGESGVTETVGQATRAGADTVREEMTANMPTGRFTTPREVATIVALLASPRMANVTGANWVIDGGLIKTT
jgi:NAD(P)-dependent dehydrogenase (short-subunit alcohol dehydrogenase family)